ncbi:MAG: TetR/AcrR family transcriptional regulator [Caulobacter sp.]|nr:TetR/AcrR family transcriptional regulator [Caulobacter sp.]
MSAGLPGSDHKKLEILTAARGVFLREGYPATGMEVVARSASVSTATLYAYFPSKAKLFEAVVHHTVRDMGAPVRQSAHASGDARSRLMALALSYADFLSRPATRAVFRLMATERRRFPDSADQLLRQARSDVGGAAIALIGELSKAGALKVKKASWAAGQLLGMLEHPTLTLGITAGDHTEARRPLDDICEDAVETFLARYGG